MAYFITTFTALPEERSVDVYCIFEKPASVGTVVGLRYLYPELITGTVTVVVSANPLDLERIAMDLDFLMAA